MSESSHSAPWPMRSLSHIILAFTVIWYTTFLNIVNIPAKAASPSPPKAACSSSTQKRLWAKSYPCWVNSTMAPPISTFLSLGAPYNSLPQDGLQNVWKQCPQSWAAPGHRTEPWDSMRGQHGSWMETGDRPWVCSWHTALLLLCLRSFLNRHPNSPPAQFFSNGPEEIEVFFSPWDKGRNKYSPSGGLETQSDEEGSSQGEKLQHRLSGDSHWVCPILSLYPECPSWKHRGHT